MSALTRRLSELRDQRGVSNREVARRCKAAYATVDNWFSGKSVPRLDQAARLAEFFGVSLDDLAGRETPRAGLDERERAILAAARQLDVADAVGRLVSQPTGARISLPATPEAPKKRNAR